MELLSVVVSVRVPRWVKEELERHGVRVAELVREILVREAERLSLEDLARELEEVRKRLAGRVDPLQLARLVDEDRWSR